MSAHPRSGGGVASGWVWEGPLSSGTANRLMLPGHPPSKQITLLLLRHFLTGCTGKGYQAPALEGAPAVGGGGGPAQEGWGAAGWEGSTAGAASLAEPRHGLGVRDNPFA